MSTPPVQPPDRRPDRAEWTRVPVLPDAAPLDLLDARFGRHHYAPHTHDEYAIGVCLEGAETMRHRGERIVSGPGAIIVVEPGAAHTGGPAGPEGYAYLALYPGEPLLRSLGLGLPRFHGPVIDDPPLATALRAAHRALRGGAEPLEAESRLLLLLGGLARRHGGAAAPPEAPGRDVARAVKARLAEQVQDPPTLGDLAADLGMSRYRLLRTFRASAGMPPYAWLAQHRVHRARALLDAGRRPAEAAALAGFADQAHLTRWFRRVLGVTPGAYRNGVQDVPAARPAE
ncbi:AraC family transcriptional regulator [Actinomadura parmotrematis]|uniref:AraC family transcriptional regulator n=1 Tax=Actinomadura parmotrematis TaxID=2864039 RepID=A0ABS7FND5_9ACTN|nr:AraC family transcriptional regulator [Actinomadura parmotrematis]MBW8481735.1 AraC family transcriptional regulator [Actinomadura parmotrematis]